MRAELFGRSSYLNVRSSTELGIFLKRSVTLPGVLNTRHLHEGSSIVYDFLKGSRLACVCVTDNIESQHTPYDELTETLHPHP